MCRCDSVGCCRISGIWEASPLVPWVHQEDCNGTKLLSTGFPGEDPSASDSLLPGSERSSVLLSNDMVPMSISVVLSNAMSDKSLSLSVCRVRRRTLFTPTARACRGEEPSALDSPLEGSTRSFVVLLANDMVSVSIAAVLSNAMSHERLSLLVGGGVSDDGLSLLPLLLPVASKSWNHHWKVAKDHLWNCSPMIWCQSPSRQCCPLPCHQTATAGSINRTRDESATHAIPVGPEMHGRD